MAAHYCQNTGTIRLYGPGKSYANRDDYEGVVSVLWIGGVMAFLHSANSIRGGRHLAAVVSVLIEAGATIIRAIRCKKHRMPRPWQIVEAIGDENVWELRMEQD